MSTFRFGVAILLLLFATQTVFATQKKVLQFQDQNWTLYINERRTLIVVGPWGEDPVIVDRPVYEVWGLGSSFGPTILYDKSNQFSWIILRGDTGERLAGGHLFDLDPDLVSVNWVVMTPVDQGVEMKIAFDNNTYVVYKVNTKGKQKLIRQGTFETP